MNITDLRASLKALEKLDATFSDSKAKKAVKKPFRDFIESTSYYQKMSDAKKASMASDVELWYSDDSIKERTQAYARKVFASTIYDRAEDLQTIKHNANSVCKGFCNIFGLSQIEHLPPFQAKILIAMCAIHLGLIPKDSFGFNMKKGIFVAGKPQIGKTSVFMYLKNSPYFSFRIITSYQLKALCEKHGAAALDEYGHKGQCLVIDEIGWESNAMHFGNSIDAVAEVIHKRYERGLLTHLTSNMDTESLSMRYQPHIVARVQKMCNIIEVADAQQFF